MSRTPLMAGNWKMNLDHLQGTHLVQKLDWTLKDGKHDFGAVEVAVMPPFTDLRSVQTLIEGDGLELKFGGQDLSVYDNGAYTGEISGQFLAKLGCTYVIVGHSERREYHNETDAVVADKLAAAYRSGLTPIFCCGEGLEVRKAGTHVAHVVAQVEAGLAKLTPEQVRSLVVAYEPIWAIGTGEVATPDDAQEVCSAIRTKLAEMYTGHCRRDPDPLWGFGQVGQHRDDHGRCRCRRRPRRWRLARPERVRGDLSLSAACDGLRFPLNR